MDISSVDITINHDDFGYLSNGSNWALQTGYDGIKWLHPDGTLERVKLSQLTPAKLFNCDMQQVKDDRAIAILLPWAGVIGGGNMQMIKYAQWLTQLGYQVTIYGEQGHRPYIVPRELGYKGYADSKQRIRSIEERSLILTSVLDLTHLKYLETPVNVILLCQGIEEYHWGHTLDSLFTPKPYFRALHALTTTRIVVSQNIKEYFDQLDAENSSRSTTTFLVPNGVEFVECSDQCKQLSKPRWNILTFTHSGQFLKGFFFFIESMKEILAKYPQTHLTVVDSNDDITLRDKLANLPHVRVYHQISHRQVLELFKNNNIYINCSLYEGFGLPSIEALATGTILIQAENHGLDRELTHEQDCLKINIASPTDISMAIERLFVDEQLCETLRHNGFKTAQRFTISKQKAAFEKIFA